MTLPLLVEHGHSLCRVVRAAWKEPLDTSFARARGGRWNPPGEFDVLYTCCSAAVARAIALETLERAGLLLDDLAPAYRPAMVEVAWAGEVVDVVGPAGIEAAGLPASYPEDVRHRTTRTLGREWHGEKREGVVGRSATLGRAGVSRWEGPHERFGELAIFVGNTKARPRLLRRHDDLTWLRGASR